MQTRAAGGAARPLLVTISPHRVTARAAFEVDLICFMDHIDAAVKPQSSTRCLMIRPRRHLRCRTENALWGLPKVLVQLRSCSPTLNCCEHSSSPSILSILLPTFNVLPLDVSKPSQSGFMSRTSNMCCPSHSRPPRPHPVSHICGVFITSTDSL